MEKTEELEAKNAQPERISLVEKKPSVAPVSRASYEIHAVSTLEEIERLRPFWRRMNRNPDADIDFYSLFVTIHYPKREPHILVATQDGHVKAIWLGRREHAEVSVKAGYRTLLKLALRQLIFLQEGFLGESNPEIAQRMVSYIMAELKAGVADRAYVSNTDTRLEVYKAAQQTPGVLCRDYSNKTTERWKTKLPANIDEFLGRRSKKHRYWLRRIVRVFEEAHPGRVKFKTYQKSEEIETFCAAAEQIAQTTYHRGLGVGFFNTTETHRRFELAAQKGWLRAYVAFVGDEPVAFWCGRLYEHVMYLEWTGYKPAYRKYEVGTVLFLKMLEDLCNCGTEAVDYGIGTAGYKERFGDYKDVEGSVSIFAPTLRGLAANMLTTVDATANKAAKLLARKLGVIDWVKKQWRTRLAGGAE